MASLKRLVPILLLLPATALFAQRGDRPDDHEQRPPWFPIPPSPALSPEEALKTFEVAPGFRIELVASEPLVEDPVAIAFDADGNIWAVEMRGWMNDADGAGNDQPIGRVVKLEDTNGDGRMDRSTVFLDGLVMPRTLQVAFDGVIVGAPPHLWFCRDTNGDGRADEQILLANNYMNFPTPQTNPEADPNGLLWNIDNWLYSARYGHRFRHRDGRWETEPAPIAGQWGLTQDDYGRHFFNTNQDQLRANPLPAHYAARNPQPARVPGWNEQVATDQLTWPIRVSPAANRGYRPGVLRPDGTLRVFEAVCGPLIYRADLFPEEFYGNAFVVDPVGHLVKRNIVQEKQGVLTAEHAYASHEFLASTDERFRPVNLNIGPDGALYVVDLYRGIIEYIHVLTTYHRRQILERGLDSPLGLGRIYRIVPENGLPARAPKLSAMSSGALVGLLADGNAWRRETAQRLLVERGDLSVVPELKRMAAAARQTVTRLHALWTLEGLQSLDEAVLIAALSDPAGVIRAAAVRLSEPALHKSLDSRLAARVLKTAGDPDSTVALQLMLSLGEVKSPEGDGAMARLFLDHRGHPAAEAHPYMASAAVSGLQGRELEFLEHFLALPEIRTEPAGAADLLAALSAAVFTESIPERIDRLVARVSDRHGEPAWVRMALLEGIQKLRRRQISERPPSLDDWDRIADPEVRDAAVKLAATFNWPGREARRPPAAPLTAEQRALFDRGRQEYFLCSTCHLPTGLGINGLAPSLVDSRWTIGPPEALARIVLQGKDEFTDFPPMPGFSELDDQKVAAILTYIRREWGHTASPVDPDLVSRVRRESRDAEGPLTRQELERMLQP